MSERLEEIENRVVYGTDTEDGRVDVWLEVADYEYLKQQVEEKQSLEERAEELEKEISSHAPEGRNYTNQQYVELLQENQRYKQALEFGVKYLQASDIRQIQMVVSAMDQALAGESEY